MPQQIHHRQSIRLKGYDYSKEGLYFITICTHERECLFGDIADEEIKLNDAGKIANECWLEIPNHFPNVILHEFIIMPNHVHGIIELKTIANVGAKNFSPLPNQTPFKSPSKTIGSIVRGYKIAVTKWFRNNTVIQTAWQRNYHDHINRNQQSYETIANYIINNPAKWGDDKFYSKK